MSYPGRGAKATAAQRAEVFRLRAAGMPIRQIAVEVFGDKRLRGRVERILAGHPNSTPSASPAVEQGPDGHEASEALKAEVAALLADAECGELDMARAVGVLLEGWLLRLVERGQTVPPAQLAIALRLWQRLDTLAAVERLRAGTRPRRRT